MKRSLMLLATVLALTVLPQTVARAQSADIAAGQTLWSGSTCASCHGGKAFPHGPTPQWGASVLLVQNSHGAGAWSGMNLTNVAAYIASTDTANTYSFSGTVTNAAGQGVGGAVITLQGNVKPAQTTTTAANGTYSFTGVNAGDYYVIAPANFAPQQHVVSLTFISKALDNGALVSTLTGVNFRAPTVAPNVAPTVTLTSPVAGSSLVGPVTLKLTATAADTDGSVAEVAFYADGTLISKVTASPFTYNWANVTARTNQITAVAKDNLGLTATSAPVTIKVTTATTLPAISLNNGKSIYDSRCADCHGLVPGQYPAWPGPGSNFDVLLASSREMIRPGVVSHLVQHPSVLSNYVNSIMTEADQSDLAAYVANINPYRLDISGTVRNGLGQPIANNAVVVQSTYNPGVTVNTDANGFYHVEGLPHGDYTVTTTLPNNELSSPPKYDLRTTPGLTINSRDKLDFQPGYQITGTITKAGTPLYGVPVLATTTPGNGTYTTTDASGNYTLFLTPGSYSIAPLDSSGFVFAPATTPIQVAGANMSGINFSLTAHPALSIFGGVSDPNGVGIAGVTISLAEAPGITATTDANGQYTIANLEPRKYTVVCSKQNYVFAPAQVVFESFFNGSTAQAAFFQGRFNAFTVSGTVRTRTTFSGPPFFNTILGQPVANAAVSSGNQTVRTDAKGNYQIALLNGTQTLAVSKSGYLFESASLEVTVNNAAQSGKDFTGGLQISYVSTAGKDSNEGGSWLSAKATIQEAIRVASLSGEVWVAAGTYYERINIPEGLSVYGGFGGAETGRDQRNWRQLQTTLSGNPPPFAIPPGFTPGNMVKLTDGSRIDGFYVLYGNASSPDRGGGINCQGASSVPGAPAVIANCYIASNTARTGAGIGLAFASPTITNNIIMGNAARSSGGGIYADASSHPIILNNLIAGNTADEGGGGIDVRDTYAALVDNNTIVDNSVTNATSSAGGIYVRNSFGNGSTFVNNLVAYNSSGIFIEPSSLANNAFTNNGTFGNGAFAFSGTAVTSGGITADPKFVDRANGDYHLALGSPAINAGLNVVVAAGAADLDGYPRIFAGTVDLGAYEFRAQNQLPGVAITSPADGSVFVLGTPVTFAAAATDTDGTITKIDYYVDQALIATRAIAPFSISLPNLPLGPHTMVAVATDNLGGQKTSTQFVIYVQLDPPPVLTIDSPANNATVNSPALTVSGVALDNTSVSLVEVRLNGGAYQTASGTATWSQGLTLTPGSNLIEARSKDGAGGYSSVASITVNFVPPDTTAPGLQVIGLVNGSTVTSPILSLQGTANDASKGDSGISSVTINGVRANNDTSTGALFAQWNKTIDLIAGLNTLVFVAKDGANNTTTQTFTVTYVVPDTTAPTVAITSPSGNITVSTPTLTLTGTASDNIGVTSVGVSINAGSIQTATGTTTWSQVITLAVGLNTIEVHSFDAAGNISLAATRAVTYVIPDITPPGLQVIGLVNGSTVTSPILSLQGTANDASKGDSGISSVTINGVRANNDTSTGALFAQWNKTIDLSAGLNTLVFVATDGANNQTTQTFTVTYVVPDTTAPTVAITTPAANITVNSPTLTLTGTASDNIGVTSVGISVNAGSIQTATGTTTWSQVVTLALGLNTIEVHSFDAAGNISLAATRAVTYVIPDTTPPGLQVIGLVNGSTVTSPILSLQGTANDASKGDSGISSVTINGVRANNDTSTGALFAQWNKTIDLIAGLNTLVFVAKDGANNTTTQTFTVTYKPPGGTSANLGGVTTGNGEFRFVLTGPAGALFVVETTTNVATGWKAVLTNTIPAGGSITVTNATGGQVRGFYRTTIQTP